MQCENFTLHYEVRNLPYADLRGGFYSKNVQGFRYKLISFVFPLYTVERNIINDKLNISIAP